MSCSENANLLELEKSRIKNTQHISHLNTQNASNTPITLVLFNFLIYRLIPDTDLIAVRVDSVGETEQTGFKELKECRVRCWSRTSVSFCASQQRV